MEERRRKERKRIVARRIDVVTPFCAADFVPVVGKSAWRRLLGLASLTHSLPLPPPFLLPMQSSRVQILSS